MLYAHVLCEFYEERNTYLLHFPRPYFVLIFVKITTFFLNFILVSFLIKSNRIYLECSTEINTKYERIIYNEKICSSLFVKSTQNMSLLHQIKKYVVLLILCWFYVKRTTYFSHFMLFAHILCWFYVERTTYFLHFML